MPVVTELHIEENNGQLVGDYCVAPCLEEINNEGLLVVEVKNDKVIIKFEGGIYSGSVLEGEFTIINEHPYLVAYAKKNIVRSSLPPTKEPYKNLIWGYSFVK